MMKKTQKSIVNLLALFFMSASIAHAAPPELPEEAIANATPHLPQQAQLNAPPFKTVTIESDTLTAYARPHLYQLMIR